MHKFSFAVPMITGVQITAKDEADARRKLALVLDAAAATSLGADPETGAPIPVQTNALPHDDDEAELYEVDGMMPEEFTEYLEAVSKSAEDFAEYLEAVSKSATA